MRLIERYIFGQLLGPTVLAALALSVLGLLSQSLAGLGLLVGQRESLVTFIQISLLAMPQLIVLVAPVALLVAGLIVISRLHSEQEIIICFAAGASPWRVVSPAIRLAGLAAIVCLAFNLWLQPLAFRGMRELLTQARADVIATLIKPGAFNHPVAGMTVYAQSVDESGTIHNLFIDNQSRGGHEATIMAREGRFERRNGAQALVLRQGVNQQFGESRVLNVLSFDEYVLDLKPFLKAHSPARYKASDQYLSELFAASSGGPLDHKDRYARLAEGHTRLATPLYCLAFMAMAVAGVLGGGFRRRGYTRRMAIVAGAAIVVRLLGFAAQAAAASQPMLNVMQYGVPVLVVGICAAVLLYPRLAMGL